MDPVSSRDSDINAIVEGRLQPLKYSSVLSRDIAPAFSSHRPRRVRTLYPPSVPYLSPKWPPWSSQATWVLVRTPWNRSVALSSGRLRCLAHTLPYVIDIQKGRGGE